MIQFACCQQDKEQCVKTSGVCSGRVSVPELRNSFFIDQVVEGVFADVTVILYYLPLSLLRSVATASVYSVSFHHAA